MAPRLSSRKAGLAFAAGSLLVSLAHAAAPADSPVFEVGQIYIPLLQRGIAVMIGYADICNFTSLARLMVPCSPLLY